MFVLLLPEVAATPVGMPNSTVNLFHVIALSGTGVALTLLAFGVWLVTRRNPVKNDGNLPLSARSISRYLVAGLSVVGIGLAMIVMATPVVPFGGMPVYIVIDILWIVAFIAIACHLQRLVRMLPSSLLYWQVTLAALLACVCYALDVTGAILRYLSLEGQFASTRETMSSIGWGVSFIWIFLLSIWLFVSFLHAYSIARRNWAVVSTNPNDIEGN